MGVRKLAVRCQDFRQAAKVSDRQTDAQTDRRMLSDATSFRNWLSLQHVTVLGFGLLKKTKQKLSKLYHFHFHSGCSYERLIQGMLQGMKG